MTEHSNTGDDLSLSYRLKRMTGKQRAAYLWYYYKWLVIGLVLGGALLAWIIHDTVAAANSRVILNVTLVNAAAPETEGNPLFDAFPLRFGYEEDESVYVDTTLRVDLEAQDARSAQAFQILAAQFTVGEIDLFVSDPEVFGRMAANGAFLPLDTLLPPETLAKWENSVYLLDNPQTGESHPCGLILTGGPLHEAGYYPPDRPLVLGVGGRAAHPETAAEMLDYLTAERTAETP